MNPCCHLGHYRKIKGARDPKVLPLYTFIIRQQYFERERERGGGLALSSPLQSANTLLGSSWLRCAQTHRRKKKQKKKKHHLHRLESEDTPHCFASIHRPAPPRSAPPIPLSLPAVRRRPPAREEEQEDKRKRGKQILNSSLD